MDKLKTIGIPCLVTCAVGVIVAGWVFPFFLALALVMAVPLLDLITDGMAYLWVLFFLEMIILVILYTTALFLLLKCFRGKERLTSLSFAFVVNVFLLFMSYHALHNMLMLSQLIIEVLLLVSVTLLILWKKTKKTAQATPKNSNCPEPDKQ